MQPNQPVPNPGTSATGIPLVEGIDPSWNDVVSYIPEDKRPEVVPKLQEWDNKVKSVEPWKEFADQGVDPNYAKQAVDILEVIENQPQLVYEALQRHLGLTPKEAKSAMDDMQNANNSGETSGETSETPQQTVDITQHPEFQTMKQQLDAATKILVAQHEEQTEAQKQQEADRKLEQELGDLRNQVGDFPEDQILMRMGYKNMTAQEAYKDYASFVDQARSRRPAPTVLGGGSQVPRQPVDVTKMDRKATKEYVAQMLEQQAGEGA